MSNRKNLEDEIKKLVKTPTLDSEAEKAVNCVAKYTNEIADILQKAIADVGDKAQRELIASLPESERGPVLSAFLITTGVEVAKIGFLTFGSTCTRKQFEEQAENVFRRAKRDVLGLGLFIGEV